MKYYGMCLASNVRRIFSKDEKYAYNELMGTCYKNNKSILLTTIVLNLLLIVLSATVDTICIANQLFYWWTVLIRIPLCLLSIFSFQIYKDEGVRVAEIIMFALATFIPCYSAFLVFYIIARTFIKEADYDPYCEDR